jgi:hypothetical protein
MTTTCREETAKCDPASHRRQNEPKLGVDNCINSHVVLLHGRPLLVNFSEPHKAPADAVDPMSQAPREDQGRRAIVVNAASRRMDGTPRIEA